MKTAAINTGANIEEFNLNENVEYLENLPNENFCFLISMIVIQKSKLDMDKLLPYLSIISDKKLKMILKMLKPFIMIDEWKWVKRIITECRS